MTNKRVGRQTVALSHPPSVLSFANIGGKFEGRGPLAASFDEISCDSFFGEKTWEKAEAAMQKRALRRALNKAGLKPADLDCIFAGDLLNQCIGSSYGLREFHIPFYGLYGACSTMGESLSLAALMIDGGFASTVAAMTSSHFCTAERQYRMPVPYGSQRPPTAQWTATAAGCTILCAEGNGPYITHVTCGRIVDLGITDANNMGAAMAPEDVKLTPCATRICMRHCFLHTNFLKKEATSNTTVILTEIHISKAIHFPNTEYKQQKSGTRRTCRLVPLFLFIRPQAL